MEIDSKAAAGGAVGKGKDKRDKRDRSRCCMKMEPLLGEYEMLGFCST